MAHLRKGQSAEWKWGKGKGEGAVTEKFAGDVIRTIKGTEVKRRATSDEPAYLLKQEDGGRVLKSEGELKGAS